MAPTFLGLDLSTQQIKAVLITEDSNVVHESAVAFDADLPQHGTKSGALHGPDGEVASPVAMWLDAIDLLLERMKAGGVDFSSIVAISGAGQQHGSVYWSEQGEGLLKSLDGKKTLASQLSPAAFSLPNAPIWQDSSTHKECAELEKAAGGAQALADLTGSRAYERFTGTQIMKIYRNKRDVYDATSRISLVSSWIPSLFLGHVAPIEVSDASGMNLMDVLTCKWNDKLVEACGGPFLRSKLGPEPVLGGTSLGKVASYWTERWGFDPKCIVAPFTGDNPATVIALSRPGDAILSLGTSTTFLIDIPPVDDGVPKRTTTSHLLSHPTSPGASIAMLCYKNGALAREAIRDEHAHGNWDEFNAQVEKSPAGNAGQLGLYYPLAEIIPPKAQGTFLFRVNSSGTPTKVETLEAPATHARAILEGQLLSIHARIDDIMPAHAPHLRRLILTGGSSANEVIRQLSADVLGMPAFVAEGGKQGAGAGGGVLAKFAWWKTKNPNGTFEEMIESGDERMRQVATPRPEVTKVYDELVKEYNKCEEIVVKQFL